MKKCRGFTLTELMIVIAVLGIVLAAVYAFFLSGRDAAERVSEANAGRIELRRVADRIEQFLGNAGCTDVAPSGGGWHPVVVAESASMTFVANLHDRDRFEASDTITIGMAEDGGVRIADASGQVLLRSDAVDRLDLTYTDDYGRELDASDLDSRAGRDMIRSVEVLLGSSGGTVEPVTIALTPPNLRLSGMSQAEIVRAMNLDGPSRDVYFFEEDWEEYSNFHAQDYIEADTIWQPILEEDFETAASWNDNWVSFTTGANGRVRRSSDYSYLGSYSLLLDCYPSGSYSHNAGIWTVDLSGYDENTDDLRLHYWTHQWGDESDTGDGVFFPEIVGGYENYIAGEDFSGFRAGPKDGWEYWTDSYGNIVVTDAYPTDGDYLNMDSRRDGYYSHNRVMWTQDLSGYSGSADLELRFQLCSRGDEEQSGYDGDFVGLAGSDGIVGTPVAYENFDYGPSGSWTSETIDLDSLAPAGYDWSNCRVLFGQYDDQRTIAINGDDGVSIDNVELYEFAPGDTLLQDRIAGRPSSWSGWTEMTVDLDQASRDFGYPFDSSFSMAFAQYDNYSITTDGIGYDEIAIETGALGIPGWTHGVYPGYVTDEWEPSEHDHYHASSGPADQSWCWSMAGSGNYSAGVTQAWLESPEFDLTGYAEDTRLSFAFFHYYDWAPGDGGNVKIWNEDTSTWDLAIPYWGYYTAAVPALGGEAGWDGSKSSWNFCVIDITEYAGQTVKFRFNYGTTGSGTADGWNIDYARVREGPDWPQIIWYGWPDPDYADWFGWSTPPGNYDPTFTPNEDLSAGNDMSTSSPFDTHYENNVHNALVSPPIEFNSGETYNYIQFLNHLNTADASDTAMLEMAPHGETIADTTWVTLGAWTGVSPNWWTTRIHLDPWLGVVGSNTVIFRWRMVGNGSGFHGGWNQDSIRCFSSNDWYPEVMLPLDTPGRGDADFVRRVPTEAVTPAEGGFGVAPVRSVNSGEHAPVHAR
jgi:prepilin-type N-terminal cleavage/methylation domain-containing protein